MEVSGSYIKNFFIFSQKKAFLISGKWNILGNRNPEKIPDVSENGTFLYFGKPEPRKNFYISGNGTFLYFL